MFDEFFRTADELMRAGRPFATATVVRAEKPTSGKPGDRAIVTLDGTMHGWIGGSCAQPTVVKEALRAIADDRSRLIRLSPEPGTRPVPDGITEVPMTCFSGGTLDIFIEPHHARPRLLIVGNLPVAQALAHLGKALNYEVVAVDPGTSDAMNHADTVLHNLDGLATHVSPLTFIVVATHGEFDEPALTLALASEAPYIGLVASRKRGQAVLDALAREGIANEKLGRIRFPAGLDILARRGDEIALGIMAEIVKTRRSLERLQWAEEPAADVRVAADANGTPPSAATGPTIVPATSAPVNAPRRLNGLPLRGAVDAATAAEATAIDPVCGMTVRIAGAVNTLEHEGRTWYFCCPGCRTRFARDPVRYAATAT
jgi:xanthine dehydrogenase accessory factor